MEWSVTTRVEFLAAITNCLRDAVGMNTAFPVPCIMCMATNDQGRTYLITAEDVAEVERAEWSAGESTTIEGLSRSILDQFLDQGLDPNSVVPLTVSLRNAVVMKAPGQS